MATKKEQMNVQITSTTKEMAKICAVADHKSLNMWVEAAIVEKADRDGMTYNLVAVKKALKKVVKRYLPGKVASHAQMLAMAQRVAEEDTEEGFTVEHHTESPSTPKRAIKATPSRSR
jgi:hypothetical protein